MHHNVLSGLLSLIIGFTSMEEVKVTFKNFKYDPIKIDIKHRKVKSKK